MVQQQNGSVVILVPNCAPNGLIHRLETKLLIETVASTRGNIFVNKLENE
jgi:hypothetical protein